MAAPEPLSDGIAVTWLKEKCGSLRVYFDSPKPESVAALDDAAYQRDLVTCELCGNPAVSRTVRSPSRSCAYSTTLLNPRHSLKTVYQLIPACAPLNPSFRGSLDFPFKSLLENRHLDVGVSPLKGF